MTLSSLATSLRKPTNWILTKHVQFPDFAERCAKFLDAESINDGIDSRVAMGEDDGDVNKEHWLVAGWAKEGNAVKDVKGKPADCEEEKNEGEGFGQLELLTKVTTGVYVASRYLRGDNRVDCQCLNLFWSLQ